MSRAVSCGTWLWLLAVVALSSGCVDRRFVIRSDPPTAIAEINSKPAGATPTDQQFIYYGTYRIVLKHEGYETLVVDQPVKPPWYEIPPLDFVSEVLIPWTIRDVRRITLPMKPLQMVPPEAVLDRAEQLRARGQAVGAPVPVPTVPVAPQPVPVVSPGPPPTPPPAGPAAQVGPPAAAAPPPPARTGP
jgi:hypothetical protein